MEVKMRFGLYLEDCVGLCNLERSKQLQDNLNQAKSLLDKPYKENREKWETYGNIVDPYFAILPQIKNIVQNPSNAWLKFWEIFHAFPLVTEGIKVFFNAELPGSSLTALNHYMRTYYPDDDYKWVASSFVGKGALGDTYGYVKKYPNNWLMNKSNNGDMTIINNVLDLSQRAGAVDLYCHDAGLDIGSNWEDQESLNYKLHLGCAIAGLKSLKIGGNFVGKQYTCFETRTWELLQIYTLMFTKFYLFKPKTSRLRNSEIYLIGLGFKGMSEDVEKDLIERMNKGGDERPMPNDVYIASDMIFGAQTEYLNKIVDEFYQRKDRSEWRELRRIESDKWLKDYPIKPIKKEQWL
jgi:23S rRNA U2552 (ribose-2'-O)-methylase RlmE/FtsJ